jgi:hypothetical protein
VFPYVEGYTRAHIFLKSKEPCTEMKTATKSRPTTATIVEAPAPVMVAGACQHHWMLGQPISGHVPATCRKCGVSRDYPAVLDDLDPPAEPDKALREPQGLAVAQPVADVSTAAGGARPSTVTATRKTV